MICRLLGCSFSFAAVRVAKLRMLAPATTAEYAQDHDSAVLSALATLLGTGDLPRHARDVAQLPLSLGGLGLASAVRNHLDSPDRQPACFAAAAAARDSATPTGLRSQCLSLAISSLQCQSHQPCPIPAISSVFSSCAACASPCLLLPGQVCSGGAGVRWSVRPHAFAEKLEPESPPTHALRT